MTSAPKGYPSPLLDYKTRGSNPAFQPLASVKNIVCFCDAKSLETVDAVSFQPTASILFAKHGGGEGSRTLLKPSLGFNSFSLETLSTNGFRDFLLTPYTRYYQP